MLEILNVRQNNKNKLELEKGTYVNIHVDCLKLILKVSNWITQSHNGVYRS